MSHPSYRRGHRHQDPPLHQQHTSASSHAYASGNSWSAPPPEERPRRQDQQKPVDSMTAAGIPQFLSKALRTMPPDHAYFHHAETVRRLLYSPEYSNGIQYNANASISANALAMGDISKKYHPFRSNNSYDLIMLLRECLQPLTLSSASSITFIPGLRSSEYLPA